ncbi:MAG: hypothetical protein HYT43_02665 [Candidatus Taylorbacteria bacterium]|nr:hypothetical protein [Candidatus Taylorbacteria bacterium]
MVPFMEAVEKLRGSFTSTSGIRLEPRPLFALGLAIFFVAYVFMPNIVSFALSLSLFLAPLWLPFMLVGGALILWLTLKRGEFIANQKNVLLEIKPPRNLVKTPLAMEAFLSSIHLSPGESNWYVVWFLGGVRPWWSLEIASFEGQVHFFIWTRANFRRIVESQMYAQYPGVQIMEAPDYTRFIDTESDDIGGVWGADFKHTSEAPLPIKTYIEYGMDKVQKEPEQVDPLANLIEFMGSIGKGEYLWLQFIVRVHKGERYGKKKNKKTGKQYTWKDEADELVDEIRKKTRDPYIDPATGEERPGFPNPTKGQSEKIAAIERNVSKLAFDVGARSVYIAKKDKFNPVMITHMIGLFKPFSTEGWNGINSSDWLKRFDDYPWEIGAAKLKRLYAKRLVEAFRRRQFFHDPFYYGIPQDKVMVMSTEELATVFHIPSHSVETPGLTRIQSATGEAPPNLPT